MKNLEPLLKFLTSAFRVHDAAYVSVIGWSVDSIQLVELRSLAMECQQLQAKAQQIAADFIGYPVDQEDETAINKATPMQAIEALEKELAKYKEMYKR